MFGLSAIEVFLVIIAIFVVLYWIVPRKNVWFPFLIVVVLLSVLAFNIVPDESDDLARYFKALNEFRSGGKDTLDRYIEEDQFGWNTYRVAAYYFYFISKLGNNSWLPAITIFIVYGLGFLLIYKAAERFQVNKGYLFLASIFFLSTYWYYDTASGIRNGLSFAIIFACAYYHLVERKNIPLCYIGYLLACFTHSAGIMPVVLVVLTAVTLNTSGKFINFLLVFGFTIGGAAIQYLATISDNGFIQSLAGKAEHYSAGESLETSTMFIVNITIFVFVAAVMFYVSNYILHSNYSDDLKRIFKYSSIIMYFMLGSIYSGLIFVRFARWIIPLIGALFFMIGMQIQQNYIQSEGLSKCIYFSPFNQAIRVKTRQIFVLIYFAYTCIHFWYLCVGSSLHWMHF